MKPSEKTEIIKLVTTKARKRGIPINVRTGGNDDLAEWLNDLLEELLPIDEPLGTIQGADYNHCPKCNGIIGQSAYYCKSCGAYIRERVL